MGFLKGKLLIKAMSKKKDWKKTLSFGGKRFRYVNWYETRNEADREAKKLRDKGKRARVLAGHPSTHSGKRTKPLWRVYVRG